MCFTNVQLYQQIPKRHKLRWLKQTVFTGSTDLVLQFDTMHEHVLSHCQEVSKSATYFVILVI